MPENRFLFIQTQEQRSIFNHQSVHGSNRAILERSDRGQIDSSISAQEYSIDWLIFGRIWNQFIFGIINQEKTIIFVPNGIWLVSTRNIHA